MGLFMWFDHIEATINRIEQKVDTLMAQVRVNSEDLDALDTALDEVTASLTTKIESLQLPEGDLTELQADLEALRALSAPKPETEPAE